MADSIFGNPTLGGTNTWTGSNTFAYAILTDGVPTPTTNRLYNVGGALYFNGSAISAGTSYWSRTGTVLSQATAGDELRLSAPTGPAYLSLYQDTDAYVTASAGGLYFGAGSAYLTWNGSALFPFTNNAKDLGTSGQKFRDLYLSRNATIGGSLSVFAPTGPANISLSQDTDGYVTVSSGGLYFGAGSAYVGWNGTAFFPLNNNAKDLGTAGLSFRDLFLGRNATIGGTLQTTAGVTYDFGAVTTAAAVLDATKYVNVTIGGVAYKLALIQ